MSRVQLALNVTDVDAAVDFLVALRDARRQAQAWLCQLRDRRPAPRARARRGAHRRDPAPPRRRDRARGDVVAAEARLRDTGLETTRIDDTVCCYATKTETWVTDPDGAMWEWYVKTGDAEQMANESLGAAGDTCCALAREVPLSLT